MLFTNITNYLWSIYFLVPIIFIISVYFGIKTNFVQFRYFIPAIKSIIKKDKISPEENSVTSFQAFMIGLGARVGTGNIAGVALALVVGGPGAIFWMWLMALLGGATAFIEATVSQVFKVKDEEVMYRGGPSYYIDNILNKKNLAKTFAIILSFGYVFSMIGMQVNTVSTGIVNQMHVENNTHNSLMLLSIGFLFAIFVGYVIFSGTKKIASFSAVIVSIMAVVYLSLGFLVIITNLEKIIPMFQLILSDALSITAFTSGTIGIAISTGFRRGIVSNEAGQGTSANAAASATTLHPVNQGFIQMTGVFFDTIIICSTTAFIILLSGTGLEGTNGIIIAQNALTKTLGNWSSIVLTFSLIFFSISTIIGVYYYGQTNLEYLNNGNKYLKYYKILILINILFFSVKGSEFVWTLIDFSTGIMALINIYALVKLRKYAFLLFGDYKKQKKDGIDDPKFDSSKYKETKDLKIWNLKSSD